MLSEIHIVHEPDILIERVKASFDGLGYPQLANVECHAQGSTIRLAGRLSSFYLKQIAQTIAIKIPGVRRVINDIEVTINRSDYQMNDGMSFRQR